MSHTFVILDISPDAFSEIEKKLREAGYEHTFMGSMTPYDKRNVIDMHGIALRPQDSADPK